MFKLGQPPVPHKSDCQCFRCGEKLVPHKKSCECFRCTGVPWNKGKQASEETKRKISLSLIGNQRRFKEGSIGYSGIHKWIKKRLPKPDKCPRCKLDKKLELSNNTNQYLRDLSDWEWICHRCHGFKDGWIYNRRKSIVS